MNDLIVNLAPTGMIPTKKESPFVPISVSEVVADVKAACEVGITMVHLHARNPKTGQPDYSRDLYADMIGGIREFAPDLIICVSLSGRTFNEFEKRAAVLELEGDLKPDMGSLTLSSLNFNRQASINSPEMIIALAETMQAKGIRPELEVFDTGMINYARYLMKKGILCAPYYFNLIFGNIACAQANLLQMGNMERDLPEDAIFSFGGVGQFQQKVSSIAIASGAGVRIGLEDNIWYDQAKTTLATNKMLVERVHRLAKDNDRRLMNSAKLRKLLQLKSGYGEGYGTK